jgi:hypothetical protein
MATHRTREERDSLREQLERRVRNGESRAEVARDLGIEQSTASKWALEGGWRHKDLSADRAEEMAEAMRSIRSARPDAEPERIAIALTEALMDEGRFAEAERAARFSNRLVQALDRIDQREARRRVDPAVRNKEPWRKDQDEEEHVDVDELRAQLDALLAEIDGDDPMASGDQHQARAEGDAAVVSGICPCCRGSHSRPGASPPPFQTTWPLEVSLEEEACLPESSNETPGNGGAGPPLIGGASNELTPIHSKPEERS